VIPTQMPLSAAEAAPISSYWRSIWLADGDRVKTDAANSALETAVGPARASDLIQNYAPYNLSDKPTAPATKSSVTLSTAFVVFPPDPPTKQSSWSQAPVVNHLADRFVVLGYQGTSLVLEAIGNPVTLPLFVGPDPGADPSETIHPNGPDLFVPDELKWLVDFDAAVNVGMGLKINLTPEQAQTGFDRLLVVGVEMSSSSADGQTALEQLLQHHHFGRSGLSIVPQGTPTHNTAGTGTGYTELDNADQSFDDRKNAPLFSITSDPLAKRDGQWIAEFLGVNPDIFETVQGANADDQIQARAMQCALWPATLGYWMDKLLTPIFSDAAIDNTRWFFTSYVSGRGQVPAIRIGGQPYGILPTTAFSRIQWIKPDLPVVLRMSTSEAFLAQLYAILRKIDADWTAFSTNLSNVASQASSAQDAHQLLLDIIGLHPASVEFYSRYAESLTELYNIINLGGFGPDFWRALVALTLESGAVDLLQRLGYSGPQPDILQHVFMKDAAQIVTVIDDRPLSETTTIRDYTDDHRNYIEWLIDAAKTSLDAVYQEQGFTGNNTPEALLYLFLRHAIMLGYYDSSYRLHRTAGFLNTTELQAMKPEPTFVHVADGATQSESRFAALYKTEPRITASPTLLVSDFISSKIGVLAETQGLADQLKCLGQLSVASTSSLERSFAEHIDCCMYRYDAWMLGFVNLQLQNMRGLGGDQEQARTGVYLGAYAWVEDLRPSNTKLTGVELPDDLAKAFAGTQPLQSNSQNRGYIHAPSLPHAETAAVLRSGYSANASSSNPDTLSINLASNRVRAALTILEGIRAGQSLGALLGYQFERGLHDNFGLAEVDKFIYPMRKAFPLAADSIASTKTAHDVPIEAIEARNVMDGVKLITQIRNADNATYPFGVTLPPALPAEGTAINAQAAALLDIYDAIADLALAEGVHQAVQGNFERIASTLEAYTTGTFPPDPEVVQTPPSGIALTHRVAVHFKTGLAPKPGATPRATIEPALDDWISTILPPQDQIVCNVTWQDPVTGTAEQQQVTLDKLALSPIDWIYLLKPDDVQTMTELDDRILQYVIGLRSPRPDANLTIQYLTNDPAKINVFQLMALLRNLKNLVERSRPLQATDAMLSKEATPSDNSVIFFDSSRFAALTAALDQIGTEIGTFLGTTTPLTSDPDVNRAAIISDIDGLINSAIGLLERSARFNISQSGWGFAVAWKHQAFVDLYAKISDLVMRWKAKLQNYDTQIAAYDALPAATPDANRFFLLRAAQRMIVAAPGPQPATSADLRADLNAQRATFQDRLHQFQTILTTNNSSFASVLAATSAITTADLDTTPFDLTEFGDRAIALTEDLVNNLTSHQKEIAQRISDTQTQLTAAQSAGYAGNQVAALTQAAKSLLGLDFRIFPEFSLSSAQGNEWANGVAAFNSGTLTQYLTSTLQIDFPVDEWLHGVARIRPNMRSWEQLTMLVGAFQQPVPDLLPIQFPFEDGASWLALQYPSTYTLASEHLLYTACYSTPFNNTARQSGLLIDEWTEVIPSTTRNTGIAFNFDRPNNEAPQSLLLVTPASSTGQWNWDDLVGALNETLDMAKKRLVEPIHLDATPYSTFLPATIMAVSYVGISITTTLAAANGMFRNLGTTNG